MPARRTKSTRPKPAPLAATARFLGVALLAVAAAGVMTVRATHVPPVFSTLNAITTFDMH
jgi:hypothetical protein